MIFTLRHDFWFSATQLISHTASLCACSQTRMSCLQWMTPEYWFNRDAIFSFAFLMKTYMEGIPGFFETCDNLP